MIDYTTEESKTDYAAPKALQQKRGGTVWCVCVVFGVGWLAVECGVQCVDKFVVACCCVLSVGVST